MMTHLAKETRQQKELGGRKQCRQNLKKKGGVGTLCQLWLMQAALNKPQCHECVKTYVR